MQLSDALDHFLLQLEADGRSVHTRKQYARSIALLERWVVREGRSTDLAAFTPEVLALFLVSRDVRDSVRGGLRKAITVNATRTALRVFFKWTADAGYVAANPARLVRRAVCSPPPPKTLSDIEVRRLMDTLVLAQGCTARRDHLLVHVMLACGIRVGSALGLNADDVDLDNGVLHVREVKRDATERVFLGRDIRDHFVGYLAGKPQWGPVFRSPCGERLAKRSAQTRVAYWLAAAGIEGRTVHSLRHRFAIALYQRTHDLLLVKTALGHKAIASTLVYAQVGDERLRAALDVAVGGSP